MPIAGTADSAPPTGFLGYLLNSLVVMANDPNNKKYYLPTFLQGVKVDGKSLVPYQTEIDLGPQKNLVQPVNDYVCSDAWAMASNCAGHADCVGLPNFAIPAITLDGINNASIRSCVLDPVNSDLSYPVRLVFAFDAYPSLPSLGATGAQFKMDMTCQCDDPSNTQPLSGIGTFDAAFKLALLNVVLFLTLNDDLTISASIPDTYTAPGQSTAQNGVELVFDKGGALVVTNIQITNAEFKDEDSNLANSAFKDPGTLAQVVAGLNQTLQQPSVRADLAKAISQQLTSLISSMR